MNDFIQLKPQSNVYEAETMVEGQDSISLSRCLRTHTYMCIYSITLMFGLDSYR